MCRGEYETGISWLDEALERDPADTESLIWRAEAHIHLKRWTEAERDIAQNFRVDGNISVAIVRVCYDLHLAIQHR